MVTKDKSKHNCTTGRFKKKYSVIKDQKQLIKISRYLHEYILFNAHSPEHMKILLDESYSCTLRLDELTGN